MGAWQSKATSPPGWSNLPPELLDLVLRRLPSLADRLRFVAVCRHWLHVATRYSAPIQLPRVLPWLNFHDGSFRSLPDGELHWLRFRKHAVCVGSFGCWLLFEAPAGRRARRPGRRRRRHRHFLMNPLRRRTIMRLPRHCREPMDLIDPAAGQDDGSYYGAPPLQSGSRSTNFVIGKVIVCSADLVIAIVNYCRSSADAVVCCRPGQSSSWSTGMCNGVLYHDMAFYKGKAYTVTWDGQLFAHELVTDDGTAGGEPRVARVEQLIQKPPKLDRSLAATPRSVMACYLVISGAADKLLMVQWIIPYHYYYTSNKDSTRHMTLKVFEADFETSQWLEVKSLDGQVLFVSSNSSRAISVSTQGHGDYLQGSKIYFVDDNNWFWRLGLPSGPRNCCGVYDMSSNTIQSISLGQVEPSWFFPHG